MEYVIYCRRSSEEESGKQDQSIPDQINHCLKYVSAHPEMKIAEKPINFLDFESEAEIFAEDNDADLTNRKTFQATRHLFIIKESKSAKIPGKREKWKKLIQQVKQGKIKGILSYSPDRQARNMLEGGEIITLVDEGILDLKYTNFHFENTPSGKMMLGVWFVFSKQYSDGISYNVLKGNESTIGRGKALGGAKYGYSRTDDGYYKPDTGFDLIQQAFQMKIYEHKSDVEIAQRLNDRGWKKKRGQKEVDANGNKLRKVRRDPFYYGKLVVSDYQSDQLKDNPHYKPMITQEEYEILMDRLGIGKTKEIRTKIKDEYHDINGIPQLMLKTIDGYAFTINLPSKNQRYMPKLEALQKTKPQATLSDVVKPNQIRFGVKQKLSKFNGMEVTFDVLEKQIIGYFETIKIDEKTYEEYLNFMRDRLKDLYNETSQEIRTLQLRINDIRGEQKEYIDKHMGLKKDAREEEIYNEQKKKFEDKIERLEKEASQVRHTETETIVKYEAFLDTLQRAGEYYEKANYVQKAKICDIFFLNMVLDKNKKLTITPKPAFQALFGNPIRKYKKDSRKGISFGADDETRTRNQLLGRQGL